MSKAEDIVTRACQATGAFRKLGQKNTDSIVRAVYLAALAERVRLAKMAHEETGIGLWQHKVIKNFIATQLVYDDIKNQKTVGIVSEDQRSGAAEIARRRPSPRWVSLDASLLLEEKTSPETIKSEFNRNF